MITLKDLSAAKKFVKKMNAKDYYYYSREQNAVAYDLCTQSKTQRSDNMEAIVMELFGPLGIFGQVVSVQEALFLYGGGGAV